MKRVFKYPLPLEGFVSLPADAHVLSVGDQRGSLVLWALVDPDAPLMTRHFLILGTGHPVDTTVVVTVVNGRFLGTVQQLGGALVWHIWENR